MISQSAILVQKAMLIRAYVHWKFITKIGPNQLNYVCGVVVRDGEVASTEATRLGFVAIAKVCELIGWRLPKKLINLR